MPERKLPDDLNPTGTICVPVLLPADDEWIALFLGAVRQLEEENYYGYRGDPVVPVGTVTATFRDTTITPLVEALASSVDLCAHSEGDAMAVGDIKIIAYDTIPTGWLLCDGTAISRTIYSALFALIGESYGAGDESTTFNLPDLRGRTPIGAGTGTDLSPRLLGDAIGAETHQLTIAEMPAHDHSLRLRDSQSANNLSIVRAGNADPVAVNAGAVGNRGGDTPHNNMQPSLVANFIIKVLP